MNGCMNERKGNEKQLDTHTPTAHLTTQLPALRLLAKSFVPLISDQAAVALKGGARDCCSVVYRRRHWAKDQGSCLAINYLCDLGRAI